MKAKAYKINEWKPYRKGLMKPSGIIMQVVYQHHAVAKILISINSALSDLEVKTKLFSKYQVSLQKQMILRATQYINISIQSSKLK